MPYIKRININGDVYRIIDDSRISQIITLHQNMWNNNTYIADCAGVSETNIVFVSPSTSDYIEYCSCEIFCISQGNNSLTFKCNKVPNEDISINILIFDQ